MTDVTKLRAARLAAGMTQGELARMSGVGRTTISEIETGAARRVFVDALLPLAATLKVSAATLMDRPAGRRGTR